MQQQTAVGGEPVWIDTLTGLVRGEKKWAETHIHGSGGGGYMHEGSGYVNPIRISSSHTTRHEFWVCSANGQEVCVDLPDSQARVREGQTVSVVWGARQGQQRGPFVLLHNGASGEQVWLAQDGTLLGSMGLRDPLSTGRLKLLVAVIFVGVLVLGSHVTGYALLAIVVSSVLLFRLGREKRARIAEVKGACQRGIQAEFAKNRR